MNKIQGLGLTRDLKRNEALKLFYITRHGVKFLVRDELLDESQLVNHEFMILCLMFDIKRGNRHLSNKIGR